MDNFIVDSSDTYYLDNLYRDIKALNECYNDLVWVHVIGHSVEGRPIPAICHGRLDGSKPAVLLTGGIHAREDYSVMLIMKMVDWYCYFSSVRGRMGNYDVGSIFDDIDFCFIPVANPDGLNIVHFGLQASSNYGCLKSMRIWGEDHSFWKANARGVDLNKNFDDGNWDVRICVPGTESPCSDRYKGPYPDSEPEVRALEGWCRQHFFDLMVSYHCSGDCVFWADSGTHGFFGGIDERIVDEFSSDFIYKKTRISLDPAVYGCGFENWFRARVGRPAFCVELSPYMEGGRQNPDSEFDNLVWQHASASGLFFASKAAMVRRFMGRSVCGEAAITDDVVNVSFDGF